VLVVAVMPGCDIGMSVVPPEFGGLLKLMAEYAPKATRTTTITPIAMALSWEIDLPLR